MGNGIECELEGVRIHSLLRLEASKTEGPKARGGAPSQTPLYSNGYQ